MTHDTQEMIAKVNGLFELSGHEPVYGKEELFIYHLTWCGLPAFDIGLALLLARRLEDHK